MAIEAPSTGLAVPALDLADIPAQQVVNELPGAVLPPAPEVRVDTLPRGQVRGEYAPRTAAAGNIEEASEDFALGVFLRSPPGFGLGHIGWNQFPFGVAEVGRIGFAGRHGAAAPAGS